MTSPSPRRIRRRPKCTKARSRGVWGADKCSGRYEDCVLVLASASMEGMAPARGDVGVERGGHLGGHTECSNARLADQ